MANSVTPIQKGFLYQAYYFWLEASNLFTGFSKVSQVCYEINSSKGFDDVQVHYSDALRGERGEFVDRDFYQLKFHIDLGGSVGYKDLIDPEFIGASKISFLQRIKQLHDFNPTLALRTRFYLFTNWPTQSNDTLSELVSGNGGEIRLDKLKQGKTARSKFGAVRECWMKHLDIADESQFYSIISTLRLRCGGPDLEKLKSDLNHKLYSVGLIPFDPSLATEPYSSLIFRLCHEGKSEFSKDELMAELSREALVAKHTVQRSESKQLGVRSFLRYAEKMENETEHMVALENYFDGRFILDTSFWNDPIKKELEEFADKYIPPRSNNIHLQIDAHSSIAFAFGSLLDLKRSVDVAVVQKGPTGSQIWQIQEPEKEPPPEISCISEILSGGTDPDVAVVLNITRNATTDVKKYVETKLKVGEILAIQLSTGIGPTQIKDANHAWNLALRISDTVKELRTKIGPSSTIHIFISAPNAIAFFLGRHSNSLGKISLYEFDFERKTHGTYEPSIHLPW